MILNKENEILDDPAYKDFINNFIDRNKNKVIYLLRYTKEESELIKDLKQATKENEKTQRRKLILNIKQLPIDRPRRLLCYRKAIPDV